jgi:UDP-GlcNAc:undecaprenyl-phosphate GlcNAc-1-phosphate transferase
MTMTHAFEIVAVPAACSAALSAGLCYCLTRWNGHLRLVAKPRPDRWHKKPTPNTGGLGIMIACTVAYLLFAQHGHGVIVVCAGFLSLLGFVDDRVELPPKAKLAGQTAATVVVIWSGVTLQWTPWYGANVLITAVWIIGITNAFNLIDNMDGLSGGVAAIVAGSGVALAFLEQDGQRALLLSVLVAACLGFLVFNHKPARIFMGDCGSLFLGFSLASLAASSPRPGHSMLESLYFIPAFFYPMFDTALVSVLRRAAGKPVSMGGRDHSSHRLVSMGFTERRAVWILWAIAGVCALCGPLVYNHPAWLIAMASVLLAALAVLGVFLASLPGFGARPRIRSSLDAFAAQSSALSVRPNTHQAMPIQSLDQ